MGYYTYITGGGEIVPPIDDAKLDEFNVDSTTYGEYTYFRFEQIAGDQTVGLRPDGSVGVVGTDPGKTKVDFGVDDSVKGYNFSESVQALADLCAREGSVLEAVFEGDGEESDDFWKLDVTNNQLTHIQGQVSFPDDADAVMKVRSEVIDRIKATDFSKMCGNVIPRPDGTRDFSCPGLPKCPNCRAEQDILTALIWKT